MIDGYGGVGSEISGGARNIFVENCEMSSPELDRALRFKTNSHRRQKHPRAFSARVRALADRQHQNHQLPLRGGFKAIGDQPRLIDRNDERAREYRY